VVLPGRRVGEAAGETRAVGSSAAVKLEARLEKWRGQADRAFIGLFPASSQIAVEMP